MGNKFSQGASASFRKKDTEKLLKNAKKTLEATQKKYDEAREYVKLAREIVHHEKYLCEIRGDDEDLIEARKRLQRAKIEFKKYGDCCNKLKSQIKHYENVQKKAQKRMMKEVFPWSFQDLQ